MFALRSLGRVIGWVFGVVGFGKLRGDGHRKRGKHVGEQIHQQQLTSPHRRPPGPERRPDDGEQNFAHIAADMQVFARVSPEQKVQIVAALQRCGRVTAMVGDGANDAAAIRMADVGIGVSGRGSSAARGAADIVLTDDDLGVLLDALVEGRSMWAGVRDAVTILVGGNVGEVLFTVIGRRSVPGVQRPMAQAAVAPAAVTTPRLTI